MTVKDPFGFEHQITYIITRRQWKDMTGWDDSDIARWLGWLTQTAQILGRECPVRFVGDPGDDQIMEIDEEFAVEMGIGR